MGWILARRKKISRSDIIGDKGIALIHRLVLDMGFVWNATGLEAGIDGYIEIRDDTTGEVTNCVLQVQSKATAASFTAETPDTFEFVCDERDLGYWLGGNSPVILIVSRPDTNEAYWAPLLLLEAILRSTSMRAEQDFVNICLRGSESNSHRSRRSSGSNKSKKTFINR